MERTNYLIILMDALQ